MPARGAAVVLRAAGCVDPGTAELGAVHLLAQRSPGAHAASCGARVGVGRLSGCSVGVALAVGPCGAVGASQKGFLQIGFKSASNRLQIDSFKLAC